MKEPIAMLISRNSHYESGPEDDPPGINAKYKEVAGLLDGV